MPCRIIIFITCCAFLLPSCSRKTLESDIQSMRSREAELNAEIRDVKQRITGLQREDFLASTNTSALRDQITSPQKTAGDADAEEAILSLEEQAAQLKQRNEQMRSELQTYRKRLATP